MKPNKTENTKTMAIRAALARHGVHSPGTETKAVMSYFAEVLGKEIRTAMATGNADRLQLTKALAEQLGLDVFISCNTPEL